MALFSPTLTSTSGSTTTSFGPDWLQAMLERGLNRAEDLSETPYTPYGQSRLAPFSARQNQAFGLADANVGAANTAMDPARQILSNMQAGPTTAGLAPWMNPYTDLVTNRSLEELMRQKGMLDVQSSANAVKAGAFGGNRGDLMLAENNRNYMNTAGALLEASNANNFNQGMTNWMGNNQAGLQGYMGMANQQNQFAMNDIQNMLGIGQMEQQWGQHSLDTAYQDFLMQQRDPFEKISFLIDRAAGVPSSQSQTTTQQVPGPSIGQQAGGIGMGLAGLAGMFKSIFG